MPHVFLNPVHSPGVGFPNEVKRCKRPVDYGLLISLIVDTNGQLLPCNRTGSLNDSVLPPPIERQNEHSTDKVDGPPTKSHYVSNHVEQTRVVLLRLIPDLHHYAGRGGRTFPLWRDAAACDPNVQPALMRLLSDRIGFSVTPSDILAYIASVAAHPAFTARFLAELVVPGLRIPLTRDAILFAEAVELGQSVGWLHTFGERFVDPAKNRPAQAPRLAPHLAPTVPADGAIPSARDHFPDTIDYDETMQRLHVGAGHIERVTPEMWRYEVSGKQLVRQWFSYRKANRERPIIGARRQPSPLGDVPPELWPAEYTTELLNMLNVLGRLIELEPQQAELLSRICSGPLISLSEVRVALEASQARSRTRSAKAVPNGRMARSRSAEQHDLLV